MGLDMIGTSSFIGIGIMMAGGMIIPLSACIWWLVAKKEKVTTVLIGAATWFIFAIILESLPKLLLFNPATSIGKTVNANVFLYTIIGALLAGVFEETGRLVAFKTALKNRTNKETGISHGLGHGGFEAMFLMGIVGVQYIVYAVMINTGTFDTIIDQAAAAGADVSALEALPAQLMSITPVTGLLTMGERIFAILLHVGLSIMVFYAVRDKKTRLYFFAMLLHTLFDVPAALYQQGILSLYVVEVMIAVYTTAFFMTVYKVIYRKDTKPSLEEK